MIELYDLNVRFPLYNILGRYLQGEFLVINVKEECKTYSNKNCWFCNVLNSILW